jgi:[protein-PII] uridylyltransferase
LLHSVATALEECRVGLRWARVATLGGSVVDSFGLTSPLAPDDRRRIEQALLAAAR